MGRVRPVPDDRYDATTASSGAAKWRFTTTRNAIAQNMVIAA